MRHFLYGSPKFVIGKEMGSSHGNIIGYFSMSCDVRELLYKSIYIVLAMDIFDPIIWEREAVTICIHLKSLPLAI